MTSRRNESSRRRVIETVLSLARPRPRASSRETRRVVALRRARSLRSVRSPPPGVSRRASEKEKCSVLRAIPYKNSSSNAPDTASRITSSAVRY
eukprot:31458-Pelagococcus_subviridis.AAC.3